MISLFIDTSLSNLVIGLIEDNKILSSKFITLNNDLSTNCIHYIDEIFKDSGKSLKDVEKIMVVNGPGSFTGIRIGVTIGKVLGWALKKEITPISSLRAIALSVSGYDYIIPVIDARRDHYYAGIYDSSINDIMTDKYIGKDRLLDKINNLSGSKIIISDNEFDLGDFKVYKVNLDLLNIVNYYSNKLGINAHNFNPNYLKKTEAEEKLNDNNLS